MFCGGEETRPPGLGVSAASVGPPPSRVSKAPQAPKIPPKQTSFHPKQKELFHSERALRVCALAHEQGLPFSLHSVVLFVLRHSLHSWVGMAPLFESIPARGAETYRPLCARAMTPPLCARALTPPLCAIRMTARPPPGLAPSSSPYNVLTVTLQNDARITALSTVRVVCTV